jgi:hypothetical protein
VHQGSHLWYNLKVKEDILMSVSDPITCVCGEWPVDDYGRWCPSCSGHLYDLKPGDRIFINEGDEYKIIDPPHDEPQLPGRMILQGQFADQSIVWELDPMGYVSRLGQYRGAPIWRMQIVKKDASND